MSGATESERPMDRITAFSEILDDAFSRLQTVETSLFNERLDSLDASLLGLEEELDSFLAMKLEDPALRCR